jgi:hypothetical protein
MKNKILSIFSNTIPYVKELRECTDSVTAAILMQQLDYWFARKPQGFYKFSEPPKSDNPKYNDGDSWTEELGFSADELRTAFSKIGVAYKSKTEFKKALETNTVFQSEDKEFFYARYFDRDKGCSFYYRNDKLVDAILDKLVSLETDDADLRETEDVGLPIALETDNVGLRETEDAKLHVLYREHSTETTSSKNPSLAEEPQERALETIPTFPKVDVSTLTSKDAVFNSFGTLIDYAIYAEGLRSTVTAKSIAEFKLNCKKDKHIRKNCTICKPATKNCSEHLKPCECLMPQEIPTYRLVLEAINILTSGSVDFSKESLEASKFVRKLHILQYPVPNIIGCVAWAYKKGKYNVFPMTIANLPKLMPEFLDKVRTGELKTSIELGDKLYQSVNDRNWKELQKNKEEILKNASNASQQLNTKHGITAKPRI